MSTRVIPVDQWLSTLNDLSTLKHRAKVRLELKSDEVGNRTLADSAPLLMLAPEMKGSEACAVAIEVGEQRPERADRLTHEVICTRKLVLEEDEGGNVQAVDIEGEDPTSHAKVTTIVRFL